jgi:hypothetical protein
LLGIELYPYLGLGMDFRLNNNYEISPYLDFIHQFYFEYEQHNNAKAIVFDMTNPYLIRTGIELIVNKFKLPIGFSMDFYLLVLGKTYPGIEILPRITIYLK